MRPRAGLADKEHIAALYGARPGGEYVKRRTSLRKQANKMPLTVYRSAFGNECREGR